MTGLFDIKPLFPGGFRYVSNFINEAEEAELISLISQEALHPMIFQGFEAKRKVASYGFDYSFDKRQLSKGKEIPDSFRELIKKSECLSFSSC